MGSENSKGQSLFKCKKGAGCCGNKGKEVRYAFYSDVATSSIFNACVLEFPSLDFPDACTEAEYNKSGLTFPLLRQAGC